LCKIAKFAADKFLDVDLYEESFNVHGITLNFFIYSKYIRDQICHFFWYFADFAKRSEQSDRPIKIYVYPPLSSVETSRFIGDEVCLHSSFLHPEVFFNVYKAGNILAQSDFLPYDDAIKMQDWDDLWQDETLIRTVTVLQLPKNIPAGDYTLFVGLYTPDTLQRLPIVNDSSGENAAVLEGISLN